MGFIVLLFATICGILLMNFITSPASIFASQLPKELDSNALIQEIRQGHVKEIDWQQSTVSGEFVTGSRFTSHFVPPDSPGAKPLQDAITEAKNSGSGLIVRYLDPPASTTVLTVLGVVALPLMLIGLIYFLVLRPAQMGAGRFHRFPLKPTLSEELASLSDLHARGKLTDEEFEKAKACVLDP
jgi:ATP-dependent Zn protease